MEFGGRGFKIYIYIYYIYYIYIYIIYIIYILYIYMCVCVWDGRLREVGYIDKMQYNFMPGRGTVVIAFVLRRLSGKLRAKSKNLFFIFVDLEKAFDWVPREVYCFALRRKDVPEYLVNGFMSLYEGCKAAVSVDVELSSSFSVRLVSIKGLL